MEQVPVALMKAHLSRYLKTVQAGELVVITDRGKPVAMLVPVHAGVPGKQARMLELARSGLARPPLQRLPKGFWQMPRPRDPQGRSLAVLVEEREEGR